MAVTKPTVGGSSGTWGTTLNAALDDHDARIETKVSSSTYTAGLATKAGTADVGNKITVDGVDWPVGTKFPVVTTTVTAADVGAVTVVQGGANAATARPAGALLCIWVMNTGVTPTNAVFPDLIRNA